MAEFEVKDGDISVHDKTFTANTVDSIAFNTPLKDAEVIRIISDGAAKIYGTLDGSTPTIGGAKTFIIPAVPSVLEEQIGSRFSSAPTVVKLISQGTPTYSITRALAAR